MTANADSNPYRPNANEAPDGSAASSSLKYLAHGIYLQLFIGVGCLAVAAIGVDTGPFFAGPKACGGILIGLGLNSLIYVHRYKKSFR